VNDIKHAFILLGDVLESERNEAYDLWGWLPSKRLLTALAGDYANEYAGGVQDILTEANLVIGVFRAMASEPAALGDRVATLHGWLDGLQQEFLLLAADHDNHPEQVDIDTLLRGYFAVESQ
jgi:hypothetical protein